MTRVKNKLNTVAVSVMLLFLVAGCAQHGVPDVAPASGGIETGVHTSSAAMHGGSHDAATPTPSAYRELLDGEIRGISSETIAGYLAGNGLGMALPAELNGYPGPSHVLDLQADLELSPEQVVQVQALFDAMQLQAIELGEEILAAEAQLEADFRNQTIDEETLRTQLLQIGDLQAQLRFVHLRTHLQTVEILSFHQVQQYNTLRGYAEMPAGHEHQGNH